MYQPASYESNARICKIIPVNERYRRPQFLKCSTQQQLVADEHDHTGPYRLQSVLTLTPTAYGFGASDAMNPDGTQARRMQVSARFVF